MLISILKKIRIIFKSLGKKEHKLNNYIKYLFWKKRNDIYELEYNDEVSSLSLNSEEINKLLPKKLAICVTFYYREEKINILKKVCKEFNVPITAAALQFCDANKAVSTMILGMDRPSQIDENINFLNYKIDKDFWKKLIKENLIDPRASLPEN